MATFTNVSGSVNLNTAFAKTVSTGVITTLNIPATINQAVTYTNGTGTSQCDLVYAKSLSLAATPTSLDLTSLTDLSGTSINFARVREVQIVNQSTTAGRTITVG